MRSHFWTLLGVSLFEMASVMAFLQVRRGVQGGVITRTHTQACNCTHTNTIAHTHAHTQPHACTHTHTNAQPTKIHAQAIKFVLVSYVMAIKRSNVLLSVAVGGLVFGESVMSRIPYVLLMLSGMGLIVLF